MKRPEREFEKAFAEYAALRKCLYLKIPDVIVTKEMLSSASGRGRLSASKRPADGVLITKYGAVLIELKAGSSPAKEHQKAYCGLANYIYSGSYLFIRKTAKGFNIEFINEVSKTVLSKALDLPELFSKIEELQKTSQNMEKSLDSKSGITNIGTIKQRS